MWVQSPSQMVFASYVCPAWLLLARCVVAACVGARLVWVSVGVLQLGGQRLTCCACHACPTEPGDQELQVSIMSCNISCNRHNKRCCTL
jgi:hypothetical protein